MLIDSLWIAIPKLCIHSTGTEEAVINLRRPNPTRKELQKYIRAWKAVYSHAYRLNTGVKWEPGMRGRKIKWQRDMNMYLEHPPGTCHCKGKINLSRAREGFGKCT